MELAKKGLGLLSGVYWFQMELLRVFADIEFVKMLYKECRVTDVKRYLA